MLVDERRHKRFSAEGEAEIRSEDMKATGDLLDVAKGGLLIGSGAKPSRGLEVATRFTVQNYPGVIEGGGKVVRVLLDTVAIMFVEAPTGLEEMLRWLERT